MSLTGTSKITLVRHPIASVYLITVDTGPEGNAGRIIHSLLELGYGPTEMKLIILTHAHFDHFSSASVLQARTGVVIAAHGQRPSFTKRGESESCHR